MMLISVLIFFDDMSFIHQMHEEDYNQLYLMFLTHSNKWNSIQSENCFIYTACTDIDIKPFKRRLTALKIVQVYVNKSKESDEIIKKLDDEYSLYKKISCLYNHETDDGKEDDSDEKEDDSDEKEEKQIILQLLQTIEKAYEKNKTNE